MNKSETSSIGMNPVRKERLVRFTWRNWLLLLGMLIPFLIFLWIFFSIESLYLPFLVSFILFYLLDPLVGNLERKSIARSIAILVIFIISGVLLFFFFLYLFPFIQNELKGLQKDIPNYINTTQTKITQLQSQYPLLAKSIADVDIASKMTDMFRRTALTIISGSAVILRYLITLLVLVPIITFFLLKDKRLITRKIYHMVPNRYFELSLNLAHKIDRQIGDYIRGKIVESIIIGFIISVGLILNDVNYAVVLGVVGGLLNMIPYLGPILGAIPGLFFAFMQKGGDPIWGVLLVYIVAQLTDNIILIPTIVAKSADLHPILVLVAVIVGNHFMGILGMIIFVPIASILKMIIEEVYIGLRSLRQ